MRVGGLQGVETSRWAKEIGPRPISQVVFQASRCQSLRPSHAFKRPVSHLGRHVGPCAERRLCSKGGEASRAKFHRQASEWAYVILISLPSCLNMPRVNPELLRWSRESARLSLDEAAAFLQLGKARRNGAEILASYEAGEADPSRALLLKMSKAYRRPLLTFYLVEPPVRAERGEDFRTLPAEIRQESAVPLDALVRDIHVRQGLTKTALEDAEEAIPLEFIGAVRMEQGASSVAERIVNHLQFDLSAFRKKKTVEEAFSYLRSLVEAQGIFVLLIGNLGSHHTNISAEVFRGFALADVTAPFIVINDQDAKSAWSFTLLHELAHVWLGRSGISGGGYEQAVEQFCNEVSSLILLPPDELEQLDTDGLLDAGMEAAISSFARTRKLSGSLVAYRLFRVGRISYVRWLQLAANYRAHWQQERDHVRANREAGGGPSYYIVRRHKLGKALVGLVSRTLSEGVLTPTKAGKILGVRPTGVAALLRTGNEVGVAT